MLTREGAHSRNRILHAHGDATGAEIARSLLRHARAMPKIELMEWTTTFGLMVEDDGENGAVTGLRLLDREGRVSSARGRAVLLASGGAGQAYSDTTNPAVATGDGIAMAWRAGAEISDMEFYQFHPTALSLPGVPRFLLSEALRGEGAWLRNAKGERFMERYHPLLELAPRDVVARAITREGMGPGGTTLPVYLDMRHVDKIDPAARFPGISRFLAAHGLELRRDLIPVRPAAHYLMGGIRTDLGGRTSVGGLYAAGEAACTGVHGANRLASNSLLEGLVFGARAAQAMLADAPPLLRAETAESVAQSLSAAEQERVEEAIARLQAAMWIYAGLLREEGTLREGLAAQAACEAELAGMGNRNGTSRRFSEAEALSGVAHAILHSALARTESRGAHFRNDYPKRSDEEFRKHSVLGRDGRVVFEAW
jgi:L-aspartate oxidase